MRYAIIAAGEGSRLHQEGIAGCKTIWYRGEQWTEEEIPDGMADLTILDLNDLTQA